MDYEDVKDGLAFFFSNSNINDSERCVFSIIDIKGFLDINNVLDLDNDDLLSLLGDMVSEGIIVEEKSESDEPVYIYDNSIIDRISGKNEDLSMRWIIPKQENYDYEEKSNDKSKDDDNNSLEGNDGNSDNTTNTKTTKTDDDVEITDEFLLEADEPENKKLNKEIIYDEE